MFACESESIETILEETANFELNDDLDKETQDFNTNNQRTEGEEEKAEPKDSSRTEGEEEKSDPKTF